MPIIKKIFKSLNRFFKSNSRKKAGKKKAPAKKGKKRKVAKRRVKRKAAKKKQAKKKVKKKKAPVKKRKVKKKAVKKKTKRPKRKPAKSKVKRKPKKRKARKAKPAAQKGTEKPEGQLVGVITHYFSRIQVVVIKITASKIQVGDKILIKGKSTDFKQNISSLQIESVDVKSAKKGQLAGLKVSKIAKGNDKVYKL